jgi:tRNA dimethylallyltransferase
MSEALFLPCILGPTGSGKTAAALALAARQPVTVINADSRQVYADFPIITAQPSPEEQAVCPHALYGFLPTAQKLGAGAFSRLAATAIAEAHDQGRLPVLVGGTGLYFKALLDGLAAIPDVPKAVDAAWQARCKAEGSPSLHALLAEKDPDYAGKIHPNDRQRITRALAVLEHTGKAFSWWHSRPMPPSPYRPLKIGFGLHLLAGENRLGERIEAMLAAGAVAEARRARDICPDKAAPGWSGIGCAELLAHIEGRLSLAQCRELWLKNTRAYAKRQLTWFRADTSIRWFDPDKLEEMAAYVALNRGTGAPPLDPAGAPPLDPAGAPPLDPAGALPRTPLGRRPRPRWGK